MRRLVVGFAYFIYLCEAEPKHLCPEAMTILKQSFIVLLALTLFSCEKAIEEETNEAKQEQTDDDSDDDNNTDDDDSETSESEETGDSDTDKDHVYTVTEFISSDYWGQVFVKGYIVGTCYQNKDNANFTPPFSNTTALLLADEKGEKDINKVIAINIGSKSSKERAMMNLKDNPDNYGRMIKVYGVRNIYLGLPGINDVDGNFEFLDE